MKAVWRFLKDPNNHATLKMLGIGISAVAAGIWAVFIYFDQNATEYSRLEMQAKATTCPSGDIHPNGKSILTRVHQLLASSKAVYGWQGGAANDQDPSKGSTHDVVDSLVAENTLIIRYDWLSGQLKLKPILPEYGSGMPGATLQGSWLQDNGAGCTSIVFVEHQAVARGWWSTVADQDQKFSNFIRWKEETWEYDGKLAPHQFGHTRITIEPSGKVIIETTFKNGAKFDGDTFEAVSTFLDEKYEPVFSVRQRAGVNAAGINGGIKTRVLETPFEVPSGILNRVSEVKTEYGFTDSAEDQKFWKPLIDDSEIRYY